MKFFILPFLLLLLLFATVWSQPEVMRTQDEGIPFFFFDAGNIAAKDTSLSMLVANVKIPYDELQFLKIADTLFQSEVEITFVVLDSDNDQVAGKSSRHKINTKTFDQTNSNKIYFSFHTELNLQPGEYSLLCEVTDLDSKKTGKQKEKVTIRDFKRQSLAMSDMLVLNSQDLPPDEISKILENFAKVLKDSSEYLVAAFEVYSTHDPSEIKIDYKLEDFRNKVIQKGDFKTQYAGFGTKVDIPLLKQNLVVGNYRLSLKIDDGKEKIENSEKFRTHVASLPLTISNLDLAIEQLIYIADKSDIQKIKNAPDSEKQEKFNKYWQGLDPTPGTPTNEVMDEYYRRIAFSNANFSAFREGWRTDMGMVYILLGPPNDVERQPYNVIANPYGDREVYAYEFWYYYDINRQFIFVDERGFGEYRLTNPNDIYLNR